MTNNLITQKLAFEQILNSTKTQNPLGEGCSYYGYGTLDNIDHIGKLLNNDISIIEEAESIIDIGCGDGDLSFFLEFLYPHKHISCIDYPKTNWNGMKAIYTIKDQLKSNITVMEQDLDSSDTLNISGDLALTLGIFYHLKNPILLLDMLYKTSIKYIILNTKIAKFLPNYALDISQHPVAYLANTHEINNDPTNWWIFSEKALAVLFDRTGWMSVNSFCVGDNISSTPADMNHDQRYFCLLKRKT